MHIRQKKKALFIAIFAAAIATGACTRSASTPPPLPGTEGALSPASAQQSTMEAVRAALLTQTAQTSDLGPFPTAITTAEQSEGEEGQATSLPAAGATEEPTVVVSTPQATPTRGYTEYVVRAGDWVYSIARDFDVHPDDIISLNGLTPPYALEPGDVLKIPPAGEPAPEGATLYRVQAGDTVFSIARRFGVDPQEIIDANDMDPPYALDVGDRLIIPQ
jgi:LysM repeat protein